MISAVDTETDMCPSKRRAKCETFFGFCGILLLMQAMNVGFAPEIH